MMEYDNETIRSLPIYKAAMNDDWDTAEHIFDVHPDKLDARLTYWWETPLHIAIGTNSSHQFVNKLIDRIVDTDVQKLRTKSWLGNTALHYAAKVGNTTDARLLVSKDPGITQITNADGHTALKLAAWYGRADTLWYLLEVTKNEAGENGTSPYTGVSGADLLTLTLTAGFCDVALYLVEKYPNMVTRRDRNGQTALQVLASKPQVFPSGSQLPHFQHLIYSWIPINLEDTSEDPVKKDGYTLRSFISKLILLFSPCTKDIYNLKLKHIQTLKLVERMCSIVLEKECHSLAWDVLGTAVSTAVKNGIYELIKVCVEAYPDIVWYDDEGYYLFIAAIRYRQEKVFKLVYEMTGHKVFAATANPTGDNPLHIAGRLSPLPRLKTVSGAALQMQRELQWFKEVEKLVEPIYRDALNKDRKTPRMVFTEEHKDLLDEGEAWMKDTSSSSTVVGTLVVTMAFAAAFTVPGGNNSNGLPLFLSDGVFLVFMVSDAIALFASTTSVLMFLAILTSRYAEEDFFYALPKRMMIALVSLFLSLAATMIAFSATLSLVLRDEISWIAAPVALLASFPVTLFAMLQFPLLVELVYSTYGPSIFR
ncbi:ankyrin repeat-containing domain, PGG domain protein [Artemisia annua]|uniref:Ankyrin repeat-containing domain, PGG domain protein n=1 Tax=Artemisia annua TaxID=35608 RepID=A0A2U1NLB6_ARTAN|nr:ankyrin repeat-containing domain, PGG domain protein [Artemisia annua]